jgi:hypothetical protein
MWIGKSFSYGRRLSFLFYHPVQREWQGVGSLHQDLYFLIAI